MRLEDYVQAITHKMLTWSIYSTILMLITTHTMYSPLLSMLIKMIRKKVFFLNL